MNWLRHLMISKYCAAVVLLCATGCGVKGDPLPPERPPELGRGRPTYRRATQDIKIEKTRVEDLEDSEDEEDESEE